MGLPEEYTYGKVVARVVQSVADGPDYNPFPDMKPASGYILFKPLQRRRKTRNYSALVLNQNVRGTLYSEDTHPDLQIPLGTLLDQQGEEGVWLVAGNYVAEFHLNEGSHEPIEFTVTPENDKFNPLDLIHASKPTPEQGVQLVTVEVPPGGAPDQTLVRQQDGTLGWQDILDDETARRAENAAQVAEDRADELRAMIPNVFVQDTPPEEPKPGDLWLDTTVRVI